MLRLTTQNRRMRRPLRSFSVLLGCAVISAYFIHHAIHGKHGLEARTRLIERTAVLSREIRSLKTVHAHMRRDVDLLGSEPPSRDMTEEIAQRDLGFVYPDDVVLLTR